MSDEKRVTGIELIAAERKRQIEQEGWTQEHDDRHRNGELLSASLCYLNCGRTPGYAALVLLGGEGWPWDWTWFKPFDSNHRGYFPKVDRLRCFVKAGALARAEEERLNRRYERTHSTVDMKGESHARELVLIIAAEIDRLHRKDRDVSKTAPAECIDCGLAEGPVIPVDGDFAGWLCPKCLERLNDSDGEDDDEDEIIGSCDNCGGDLYEYEDDGSGLCDQCQWYAAGGPSPD